MKTIRIAAAQTPEFRNDVDGALLHLAELSGQAAANGAALLCFPEGFLQGYLTEEETARQNAIDLTSAAFQGILQRLPKTGPTIAVGLIEIDDGRLFNTAVVIQHRTLLGRYRKTHLLKGERFFEVGADSPCFEVQGLRFGINICYDTNFPEAARKVAESGAALIVCLANNMMPRDRAEAFRDLHNAVRGDRCRETGLWLISSDVTGARDDRLALGPTAVLDPAGRVVAQLPLGRTGLLLYDVPVLRQA